MFRTQVIVTFVCPENTPVKNSLSQVNYIIKIKEKGKMPVGGILTLQDMVGESEDCYLDLKELH